MGSSFAQTASPRGAARHGLTDAIPALIDIAIPRGEARRDLVV
jgi:hypothetical protein